MKWKKLGLVYAPHGESSWAVSHAASPTVTMIDEDRLRIFVAFLDRAQVGRIGYVDVDAADPRRVLKVSKEPVLNIGVPGTFDDNGVMPISIIRHEGRLLLYYIGWQLGVQVRYYLFIGLAVSDDDGETFTRGSQAPILDRSDGELFVRTAAFVRLEEQRWKMWYIAGDRWIDVEGKQVPTYNMRYLESDHPAIWGKSGRVILDVDNHDEYGLGRPFILKEDGVYKMWYSIRTVSKGYRLGYAESPDGLSWERKDDAVGIDVSDSGWDSEMVCFSSVQPTRYGTYMFYNGNNYGETGFGVALLANEE
jgi:predicted GH43/DUF377 family glycosyl hydrolase